MSTAERERDAPAPAPLHPFLLRLLLWAIPRSYREELAGDLLEEHEELRRQVGPRAARLRVSWRLFTAVAVNLRVRGVGRLRGDGLPGAQPSLRSVPSARQHRRPSMNTLLQDLRFALRTFRKRPLFVSVAVGTLGLGIGASTAMFSVVDGVLLRPPSYRDPDRVVKVWQVISRWQEFEGLDQLWDRMGISFHQYRAWQEHNTLFEEVALFHASSISDMTLTGLGDPLKLTVGVASASLLPALGVSPVLGRNFLQEEDASISGQAGRVALLSSEFWRTRFGADPDILGRTVRLNGQPFEVVGVLPPDFRFVSFSPEASDIQGRQDLWIPLGNGPLGNDSSYLWDAVGRLSPGVPLAQAREEIERITEAHVRLVPRQEEELADMGTPLALLLYASGILLLIGCTNVAILTIAESEGRLRELAIRSSLGAGRLRIVRQLLTESVALGSAGTVVGAVVAFLVTRCLLAMAPPIPRLDQVGLNLWVLGVGVALGLTAGIVAGTLPALLASRPNRDRVRAGALRGPDPLASGLQQGLVGLEIALTVVLLVVGGLLGRSLRGLTSVDPGFEARGLATLLITLPGDRYDSPERRYAFMRELVGEIRSLPAVESAALADDLPFPGETVNPVTVRIANGSGNPAIEHPDVFRIWPGDLEALRIPLLAGRTFTESAGLDGEPVVLVSDSAARRIWPGASPVGAFLRLFGMDARVIGVVGDVRRSSLGSKPSPTFYVPLALLPRDQFRLVARTEADPRSLVGPMRGVVRAVDPGVPVTEEATMHAWVSRSTREEQYRAALVAVFGVLAILMAAAGIFGITARSVARRSRELGVRMAMGAQAGRLLLDTLRPIVLTGTVGVFAGLLAAAWASRLVVGFLFDVEASDPLTFGGVAFLVMGLCTVAALIPARRVAAVDPARVLKEEF